MYVLVTFGYAAYMYYNGGMVIWQIDFVEEHFGIQSLVAVLLIGGITVFNGVISTTVGAILNDKRILKRKA